MKKIFRTIKACTLYFVFAFFVTLFVTALSERGERFRFRNGDLSSPGQSTIAILALFLLTIVGGYGAFKRAQLNWKIWKKKHRGEAKMGRVDDIDNPQ